jgi:sugar phosphate isomerase/epimerase
VLFGISTHLYHDQRLALPHLQAVAAHGFDAIELFATRTHFDYHQAAAIADLRGWLQQTGLRLHSIHAPIVDSLVGARWGKGYTNATADEAARKRAMAEIAAALAVARDIRTDFLVVHLGTPDDQAQEPGDNSRDAARRSVEEIHRIATDVGVHVALENIPNTLSDATMLVDLLEDELELPGAGICLDFGHAFLTGDLIDAIEAASGHLITTHVHDNHGTVDEHLAPFDGAIDWASALTAMQKVGYEGRLLFELRNTDTPEQVLARAVAARERFERILAPLRTRSLTP